MFFGSYFSNTFSATGVNPNQTFISRYLFYFHICVFFVFLVCFTLRQNKRRPQLFSSWLFSFQHIFYLVYKHNTRPHNITQGYSRVIVHFQVKITTFFINTEIYLLKEQYILLVFQKFEYYNLNFLFLLYFQCNKSYRSFDPVLIFIP